MLIATFIILGLFVGLVSSILGVGGGFLTVPIIAFIFSDQPLQLAVSTSLGVIAFNSLLNSFNFYKIGKRLDLKTLFFMGTAIFIGILAGGKISLLIPQVLIKKIFASLLLLSGVKTLVLKNPKALQGNFRIKDPVTLAIASLTTFSSGIVSGLTGLGGGIIMVPLFIHVLKIRLKDISFVSNLMMGVGSISGVISYCLINPKNPIVTTSYLAPFQIGLVNWGIIVFIFIGGFFGSRLGVNWGQKLPEIWTKRVFAALLLAMALKMLLFV